MTKRQKALGVTAEGYKTGITEGNFLLNNEAFLAKIATLKKGEYSGIDIIKQWIPEYAEYENCMYMKLEEMKPFLFGLTARIPKHFYYTDTNGLDCLTVR